MAFTPRTDWVNDAPPGFEAAEMIRIQVGLAAAAQAADVAQGAADQASMVAGQAQSVAGAAAADAATALAAAVDLGSGLIRGADGRTYALLSCVLRNTGSGWGLIEDSGHRSSGVASISSTSTGVVISHNFVGSRVSSIQATPDETLSSIGVRVGASAGTEQTILQMYTQPEDRIEDRVFYDWNATPRVWVSENGVFSGFAASGTNGAIITMTHENMGSGGSLLIGNRGSLGIFSGGLTATTSQIVLYSGAFGSLTASAPTSSTSAYVVRTGRRAAVAPTAPSAVVSAQGNIWVTGLYEV